MKIYETINSIQYKELLIDFFQNDIVLINKFSDDYLGELNDLCKSEDIYDELFKAIRIAEHTRFCFILDERQVGVFCDQYIVAFNAGISGFDFIGDNVSNWLDYFGSATDTSESDAFKLLCYQNFKTPITTYDRWDTSHLKLVESILTIK